LYERKRTLLASGPTPPAPVVPWPVGRSTASVEGHAPAAGSSLAARADRLLLERFAPPTLIINTRGDIAYIHGRTGAYLEIAAGEPRTNLFAMAREGLRLDLPAAVRIATAEDREVLHKGIRV